MSEIELPVPKKMKLNDNEEATIQAGDEVQCKHFVLRKKRFCKMTVAKGRDYCGQHMVAVEDPTNVDKSRIHCPLDPKHTVFKYNLEKHLKICNSRKSENVAVYIKEGINNPSVLVNEEEDFRLADVEDEILKPLIKKVEDLYAKHCEGKIDDLICEHEVLDEELKTPSYGPQALKHLKQTSSILGILKHEELLKPQTCFIEYGAGKGIISFWLAKSIESLKDSKVILLDRASHRHKKDNKIDDPNVSERIKTDIADFDLKNFDRLDNCKDIVGVSKHLCGAATDLTLRCIVQGNANENVKTKGILVCVCCHHQCQWNNFVGTQFFLDNGFDQKAFKIIIKMVSWCVCGDGLSRDARAHKLKTDDQTEAIKEGKMDRKRKEEIGWKCKRIIDYARMAYLQDNNYEASMKIYTEKSITLENLCIIGKYKN
ncbi:unnamed protein product [Diamesa tonsa]